MKKKSSNRFVMKPNDIVVTKKSTVIKPKEDDRKYVTGPTGGPQIRL